MGRGRTTESAKKRRIQEERKRRNQSRICLGVHFDRFNSLRENTESSKSDVIKHLLDVHDQFCDCSNVQTRDTDHHELTWSISTSGTPPLPITPGPDFSTPVCDQVDTPGTFRVDNCVVASEHCDSLSTLAASLQDSPEVPDQAPCETPQPSFSLSRGQEELVDEIGADEEYDPNVSDARATFGEDLDTSAVEEDLLNMPLPEEEEEEEEETSEPLLHLVSSRKFICYLDPVMDLVKEKAGDTCTRPHCDSPLTFTDKTHGTALVIRWKCTSGHSCGSWASQP